MPTLEDMMRAMEQGDKEGKAARDKVRAVMWPNGEGEQASMAAINFTFNSVFCFVMGVTTDGSPEQEAAVSALADACAKTRNAASEQAKNGKFPAANWFHQLAELKAPDDAV